MLTHMFNKICRTCGILDKPSGMCSLTGRQVDPDADFCSQWTDNVQKCDMCGREFLGPGTLTEVNGEYKQTCNTCTEYFQTCRTCANRKRGYCKFNDQSFRPDVSPVITKSIQKGPAILQAQVRNPEREKITCQQGCLCYKDEFGCCRETHTCGNYKENW